MALALLGNPLATAHGRTGPPQRHSEAAAPFGLVAIVLSTPRWRPGAVAIAVGFFITAGNWFTASTSFANPAVTIARLLTDTFSGIDPAHVPAFIVAQVMGAMLATGLFTWLHLPALQNSIREVAGAVKTEPAER
jgi:glycerol uptake facilitator-like aquaporin